MSKKIKSEIVLWSNNSAFLYGRTGNMIMITKVTKTSRSRIQSLSYKNKYIASFFLRTIESSDSIWHVDVAKKEEYVCHNKN